MRIICDLLSTIMPPPFNPLEECRRPNFPPLLRLLNPVVYAGPAKANRKEAEGNA